MQRKKSMALILMCVIALFSTGSVFAQDFTDMKEHWAQGAVKYITDEGVMSGYPDGTFKPSRPITKIESISMICRLFLPEEIEDVYQQNADKYQTMLDNAKIPVWAQKNMVFAMEKKFFSPASINKFMVSSKGTLVASLSFRQEFIMLLGNALNFRNDFSSAPVLSYTDKAQIGTQAVPYVDVAVQKGIISGTGTFNPKRQLTRADAAVMLFNAYKYSDKAKEPTYVAEDPTKVTGKLTAIVINGEITTLVVLADKKTEKAYTVSAKDSIVTLDGQIALLSDLQTEMNVTLKFEGDKIVSIEAMSPINKNDTEVPKVEQ